MSDKYLSLIPRPLDEDQSRVCMNTKNAVIAAGAGSGKTQVLATRFAWLVMSRKIDVSQILTLTFTDKAASEMYKRIYDTLTYFANYTPGQNPKATPEAEADLTPEKIALTKKALADFSNSHIQTLDSYCGGLVRQCASRYGLSPDFSVGSADSEREIKNAAFRFILDNRENIAVQTFANAGALQDFAEKTFAGTIIHYTSIATEENWFLQKLQKQTEEIVSLWNYMILEKKEGLSRENELRYTPVAKKVEMIEAALSVHKAKDDKAKAHYVSLLYKLFELSASLKELPSIQVSDLENKSLDLNARLVNVEAFIEFAGKISKTTGAIGDIKTEIKNLLTTSLATVELLQSFIKQYEAIKALNLLFEKFLKEVNATKRQTSSLTFNDVSKLSLKVLIENEDIRNQEKSAYKMIMIDEFQDNNGANRDLLYLLSLKENEFTSENPKDNLIIKVDPNNPDSLHSQIIVKDCEGNIIDDKRDQNKLFFVGDEKQSIYKFRGADVTVFNELTDNEPQKSENALLSMNFNYRSNAELVQSFNMTFKNDAGIFLSPSEDQKYEANYAREAKKKGMELPELNSQNVRLHFAFSSNKKIQENDLLPLEKRLNYLPQKEQDAYFLAKKIRQIADKEKCSWDSFAILGKSRTDYQIVTKYLSLFKIPFAVDQFKNIFEDAVVNDFYNFLRICVYPSDINAFAAWLCSPFAGLTENEAEIVLSHLVDIKYRKPEEKPFVFNPFADFDEKIKQDLSPESFNKFISARNFYKEHRLLILRQKLTQTLTLFWHQMGYKYETMLSPKLSLCAEQFDMLFELARTAEESQKGAAWFIDELDSLKSQYSAKDADLDVKEISYPLEKEKSVQIMTIHKSKGLQFDYVFVWGTGDASSRNGADLIFCDENYGITIKADGSKSNFFYEKQKAFFKFKEIAEFRRLIYVAITRAIKDCWILGQHKVTKTESTSESDTKLIKNMAVHYYPDYENDGYAEEEPVYLPESPFDYQNIPSVTYSELLNHSEEGSDSLRAKAIENAFAEGNIILDSKESPLLINTSCNPILKGQPSHIEEFELTGDADYISSSKDKYSQLSLLLSKYSPEPETEADVLTEELKELNLPSGEFSAADFGTLIHDYLNKMCSGIKIEEYKPQESLLKNLSEEDKKTIREYCLKMCHSFAGTDFYKSFVTAKENGKFAESELEFKYYDGKTLYHGSIDLIYENPDGTYTILDYKTDRIIEPAKHYAQQKCYRQAAQDLVPCPKSFNLQLYYLRFDEAVDITNKL